jgi:hypothetical protein
MLLLDVDRAAYAFAGFEEELFIYSKGIYVGLSYS